MANPNELHAAEDAAHRATARARIRDKRDLVAHLVTYVVVNAGFIAIWAMTGRGFFWPAWILAFWAVGIILQAWTVWWEGRPLNADDIDRELDRHPRPRR